MLLCNTALENTDCGLLETLLENLDYSGALCMRVQIGDRKILPGLTRAMVVLQLPETGLIICM
jgi:hypothetical protein